MKSFLYLDRRLVLDQLAVLEGGVQEQHTISASHELLRKLGGEASLFNVVKAGGSAERTARDSIEQIVRQAEASELDRLESKLKEAERWKTEEFYSHEQPDWHVRVGALVEVTGCVSVPPMFEAFEWASKLLSLDAPSRFTAESQRRLAGIQALSAVSQRTGPACVLRYELSDFSWVCRLDASLLRRPIVEFAGKFAVLGFVTRRLSEGGSIDLVPSRGLDLLADDDKQWLLELLHEAQGERTSIPYPAGELLPMAIYREEAGFWERSGC